MRDDELAERLEHDFESAGLDARRLGMLHYAAKLTRQPSSMLESDVENLRQLGFGDSDILGIVEVCAYYAYVNRLVDGLGVQLEAE